MSVKMQRRRRHARLKRVRAVRREDGMFFKHGTFPDSASTIAMCSCGARAFARVGGDLDDFHAAHADCGDEVAS